MIMDKMLLTLQVKLLNLLCDRILVSQNDVRVQNIASI